MTPRIIARLDIKGPNLVKGIHLEGLRVLGKPERFANHYYETGADELMYMDVVASLYNRNSLRDIITRTAKEIAIPLTVGGGIRTLEDIRDALRAGADKVSINTAAIKNPDIIRQAAERFGSSTIVVTLEVIQQTDGRYLCFTDNGREFTGVEALEWARKVEELGAGELVLTSVDKEGTGLGFDTDLVKSVSSAISIPVIAHGGAGKPEHVEKVLAKGGVSAVAVASMFHYGSIKEFDMHGDYESEGNLEFLKSGRSTSRVTPTGIGDLKSYLRGKGMVCRYDVRKEAQGG
jgi:cyclase